MPGYLAGQLDMGSLVVTTSLASPALLALSGKKIGLVRFKLIVGNAIIPLVDICGIVFQLQKSYIIYIVLRVILKN